MAEEIVKSRCDGDTIDETIKNKKIVSTFPDSHGNYRKIKQRKTKRKLSRTVEEEADWLRLSWSLPMPAKIAENKEFDGKDINHNKDRRNRKKRILPIRINNDGNIINRNDQIDSNNIICKDMKNVKDDENDNNNNINDNSNNNNNNNNENIINNNNNDGNSNNRINVAGLRLSSDESSRSKSILSMKNENPLSLPLPLPLNESMNLLDKMNCISDQHIDSPNGKTRKLLNMIDSSESSSMNGNTKNRNRQTGSGDDENVRRDHKSKEKVVHRWAQLECFSQSVGRLLPYQLSYLLQHVKSRESKIESERRKKQSVMEKEIEKEVEKGRSNDSHASRSSHFNMSKKNSDYDSKNYSVNNQTDLNSSSKNVGSQKYMYPPSPSHGLQHGQQTPLSPACLSEDIASWLKLDGVRHTILAGLYY